MCQDSLIYDELNEILSHKVNGERMNSLEMNFLHTAAMKLLWGVEKNSVL